MADEDAALNETIDHLGEASRRVRAARRLMDVPNYLRQGTRPSKALHATEAAHREDRRRGDYF
jgi:hypothetical protein